MRAEESAAVATVGESNVVVVVVVVITNHSGSTTTTTRRVQIVAVAVADVAKRINWSPVVYGNRSQPGTFLSGGTQKAHNYECVSVVVCAFYRE
jgi:hypothetical protein